MSARTLTVMLVVFLIGIPAGQILGIYLVRQWTREEIAVAVASLKSPPPVVFKDDWCANGVEAHYYDGDMHWSVCEPRDAGQ